MRRLKLFLAAAFISTPLMAMHCPADMARIDGLLQQNPPADEAVLEQVRSLRSEGESLHNAGKHSESVAVLAQALALLEGSE